MGSGASIEDFNPEVYRAANSVIQPRVIYLIDTEKKEFHCRRQNPSRDVFAVSHRWELRGQVRAKQWTVIVGNEPSYTCEVSDQEVEHIQSYLRDCIDSGGIWLDYVCIDQNAEQDKNAQVAIMGSIYLSCTTLILGLGLAPKMPPSDYVKRAWCIQERMFGYVKMPWQFEECSTESLKLFAAEMLWTIPHMLSLKLGQ